jgi:hypothetical protein
MTKTLRWLRRQLPGVVALTLVAALFFAVRLPTTSKAEKRELASTYKFTPLSIALPGGYKQQTIRKVNKKYEQVRAWISSVGAGIAMNDLDGDGRSNDLCLVDPRIDQAVVTPTPGAGSTRYAPFALTPGSLPMNDHMAPMGCLPGDFNEDGRMDLLLHERHVHRARVEHQRGDVQRLRRRRTRRPLHRQLLPERSGARRQGERWRHA